MSAPVEVALHLVSGTAEWDVVAELDGRARVEDLATALEPVVGHRPSLYRFGEVLDGAHALDEVGVRAGDTLGVDVPVSVDLRRFGPELHIVGGQGAGRRYRLTSRPTVIGRAESCDVVIGDGRASRTHAEVTWSDGGFAVSDLGSRNGTVVDGVRLVPGIPLACAPGQPILIGDTVVTVSTRAADSFATRLTGPFHVALTPQPLPATDFENAPIVLPAPSPDAGFRRSLLVMAAPVAGVGAVAAAGAPLPTVAAFAAVPAVLGAALMVERVRQHRRIREHTRGRGRAEAAARVEITRRRHQLEDRERQRWPDPASIASGVARRAGLVWSHDGCPLSVRVGLGDRVGAVSVIDPSGLDRFAADAAARLVPRTVDITAPVGIVGPERDLDAVAEWIVVQLLALRPPHELEMVVLSTQPEQWAWLSLAPHATTVVDARSGTTGRGLEVGPRSSAAMRLLVLDRISSEQAAVVTAPTDLVIWRSAEHGWFPPGTATTLAAGAPGRLMVTDSAGVEDVIPDAIAPDVALQVARALSGVRTPSSHAPRAVPPQVRFVDLAPDSADADALVARWSHFDAGSLVAVVGADGHGQVDVRLAGHNSHVLVAGSTGSGKTRLVESLVLSLAAQHSPDRFNFFLVDFKGGNELARLAELPHCRGSVSDRDRNDVDRAVRALAREVARRDEVLAAAGAADIDEYERATRATLPRLLIVADEFGQFRRDDTTGSGVAALLRIAAQGRSKGVHLLLATQSPSTDVTPEIRQNVGVRICLRVAEGAESVAVLGVTDAAELVANPGRAVLLVDGRLREFQGALARVTSARARPRVAVRTLSQPAARPAACEEPDDLTRIIDAMNVAAAGLGLAAGPLMAPALPERVARATAPGASRPWTVGGVVLGVADRPGATEPSALVFDPATHGTMVVIGGPRSGRTTALLAAAEAARAQTCPERELVVFGVDWGDGLAVLRGASNDAGVVARGDFEHLRRLVAGLRGPGDRTTTRLVLVDRLDQLLHDCRDLDAGAFGADLISVLNDGPARGVFSIVTTDAAASATGPASRLGGPRLVLPLAELSSAATGLPRRGAGPPGRVLMLPDGVEAQIGWPAEPPPAAVPPLGRIEALPTSVRLGELGPAPAEHVIVGVGGSAVLAPVTVNLDSAGPILVVIGRAGSGRSTALAAMAASYRGRRKVVDVRAALTSGSWDDALAEPSLLIADDEPALRALAPALGAPDLAEQLVVRGHVLVASFEQAELASLGFSHWLMRRPRPGVLLSLDASADRLLACERVGFTPPPELRAGQPGRGWWCDRGVGTPLQVAAP